MDAGKVTSLTLLDPSAAFDTTDHTIHLRRLEDWFGVTGKALDWFKSYLIGRCQRINLGDFASGYSAAALNGLQSCLASVQSWMLTNKLKLNPDETEFFLIGNERQQSKYLSIFPTEVLGVKTNPAKSARNLGVIFDKIFTFSSHISAVCRSCLHHMQDLWLIRHHLNLDSATLLATALISSHLDY